MKYWILTTEYPPFFGGGISTYCIFTAKMLADNGYDITVFVNDQSITFYETKFQDKIRVVRFNPLYWKASEFLGHNTNISYGFARIIEKFSNEEGSPDFIESQDYLGVAYYLLQFKKLLYEWCKNIKILITAHSPAFLYLEFNHIALYKYPNYWIGEMERFCYNAADHIIFPSKYLYKVLSERFEISHNKISFIANPYWSVHSSSPKQPLSIESKIVFFGKLSAQKGTFKLLHYFSKVWDDGFDQPLHLIGGADIYYHPEQKSMGSLIKRIYKKYIHQKLLHLEEKIPPEKITEKLASAKLIIFPSTVDNLPYVVLEMMALGKIILASKQGGQSEIIQDGYNGFIFDHEDPETFETKLKEILSLSKEKRAEISHNAIKTISQNYNADRIVEHKKALLDSLQLTDQTNENTFPSIRMWKKDNKVSSRYHDEKNTLSIIIPFYNLGNYLEETVYSVLENLPPKTEIIIINDGSNEEESLQKLNEFRSHEKIKIYDTPNKGLAHARNFGSLKATGCFITFLDADDKVLPTYYTKAIEIFKQYSNVHFIGCWVKYFDRSEKTWPTFSPEPPLILIHNSVNSSSLIYRKSSFLTAGMNNEKMSFQGLEDYDSVVSMIAYGYECAIIPEPLFQYRVRASSMIRSVGESKRQILYEEISRKNKLIYEKFGSEISNILNVNGSGIYLDNPTIDTFTSANNSLYSLLSKKLVLWIKNNNHLRKIAYSIYRKIYQ